MLGSRNSYTKVARDVFVSSPLLLFVQMAGLLEIEHLIELGFELCGSYSLCPHDLRGFCDADPLLTSRQIVASLERQKGMHGLKKARRGARYVLDGAASPRETAAAIMLCLPKSLGGYGLPRAQLNMAVPISAEDSKRTGRRTIRCDMYWPKQKLALEYESDAFHNGDQAFARDSERRNDLRLLEVETATLTNGEIKNKQKMDRVAQGLQGRLGARSTAEPRGYGQRQQRLRSLLLDARQREHAAHVRAVLAARKAGAWQAP